MVVLVGAAIGFAYRFEPPALTADGDTLDPEPTASDAGTAAGSSTSSIAIERTTTTAIARTTTTTTIIPLPDDPAGGDVFDGSRIYTNWGWVKVAVRVVDGTMVDIDLVMVPRATKRSEALAIEYEPILREQALERQSADVDAISGATIISDGYRRSLIGAMKAASIWSAPDR